jgi:hypothetical protein
MAIKFLNTATAATQAVGDNSTKIATTAYADAAASAIPIGDYLPLSAGASKPLTGGLYIPHYIYHAGDTGTFIGFPSNDRLIIGTNGGTRVDITNSGFCLGDSGSNISVSEILDEEDMASDSATALATQQSIKAYVDAQTPGAGVFLPLAGGTLTGPLTGTSAGFTQGVYDNVDGLRLLNPGGGSSIFGAAQSGAIKVTLPVSWTNTMMRMTIKVYEYTTNESFTIICGGYNYSSGTWVNHFAYIESSAKDDRNFTVRFGHDGTKCCVYIGELASTWSHPQIFVTEFEAGYSGTGASAWKTGWDVGFETSAFGTITQTETNTQVNNWARNGQDTYFSSGSGNVGIGKTSPQAKLHVEGGIGIFNVSDDWHQSSLGTNLFRGGNFATTISNETSTLKIFPATAGSRVVGNYWGGINFMHLDPENSTWGTSFTGGQFWIGGRITSLPGQELSALVFATNSSSTSGTSPTEKMVILPNGNVGIGTTDPYGKLDVAGNIRLQNANQIYFGGTGSIPYWNVGVDNTTDLNFVIEGVSYYGGDRDILLNPVNNGNIGIGTTSPSSKLTVSSSTGGDGSWNKSGILIENTSTNTGEPTLSFRNAGGAGTGANYWHTGLNQSNVYKLAYGTSFTGANTKLALSTNGALGLNSYTSYSYKTSAVEINPIQNFYPSSGAGSDTTTDLGVDQDGNVVRTTQEATWHLTDTQVDAITTGTTGTALLSAPGAGLILVVEKVTFMIKFTYDGQPTSMSTTQKYEITQAANGSTGNEVAVMNGGKVNDIACQGDPTGAGIYEHDTGYSSLNRTYNPNQATRIRRTESSSLPPNVTDMFIKMRYRVYDPSTF